MNEDAFVRGVLDMMSFAQIRRVPVVNRNNELGDPAFTANDATPLVLQRFRLVTEMS